MRSLLLVALLPFVSPSASAPAEPTPAAAALLHCQVPCGIYGDRMRIDMLMEDAATIEKGMASILQLEAESGSNTNQMVRWVVTKDQHAQAIQETVASYWLAQRIKAPAAGDEAGAAAYHQKLALLHGITVAAMKCKQTTDASNVTRLRQLALEFSAAYFSKEDAEHIREHHGAEER